jgi:hypothetical protein
VAGMAPAARAAAPAPAVEAEVVDPEARALV